jgi:hypothetical protein
MSKNYGVGQLKAQVNTLQSLLLTQNTATPTLQQVLDTGDTAQGILTINAPPGAITNVMRYDTQIVSDAASNTAVHQTDGFVATNQPFGADYGQLLKDRLKFEKSGYLTEIINDGTQLNINGQVSFNNPPHSVDAINGNDLVTKGYVDGLVGQYSGGFNFFLNYSVVDGLYKSLGQSVVAAAQQIVPITTDTTNQLVAEFVSSALGITSIPSGIWNVLVFSEVAAIGGVLTYFFEVYKLTGAVETLIFTSGTSTDVNATTTPTAFGINGTLTAPYALALTDKIVIKIYQHKDGAPLLVNTYFQNAYYSFVQSTLNAGTTLLSSNNTFTGTNDFTLAVTAPSVDTLAAGTLSVGVTNATAISIGKAGVNTTIAGTTIALTSRIHTLETANVGTTINSYITTTTGAYNLLTTNTGGIANLFTSATRTATLNIQNGSASANIINIGSATSATNILGLRAATLDSITSSVLSVGSNVLTTGVNMNNKVLSGLTYGVNEFITLSTNTASPSATQIGYFIQLAGGTGTTSATPNTSTNLQTYASTPSGTWLFEISFFCVTAGVLSLNASFSTTSATFNANKCVSGGSLPSYIRLSAIIPLTASSSVFFVCNSPTASVSVGGIVCSRTRIA